jgi:hypothetical protein
MYLSQIKNALTDSGTLQFTATGTRTEHLSPTFVSILHLAMAKEKFICFLTADEIISQLNIVFTEVFYLTLGAEFYTIFNIKRSVV